MSTTDYRKHSFNGIGTTSYCLIPIKKKPKGKEKGHDEVEDSYEINSPSHVTRVLRLFIRRRDRNKSNLVGCLSTLALLIFFGDTAMRKCLPLNLLKPTSVKKNILRKTYATFLSVVREVLSSVDGVTGRGQLHRKTYMKLKDKYNIASQLLIEATSYAWSARKTVDGDVRQCVVRFDKRLFSFSETNRGNPVLTLRTNDQRIGLPLSRDGAYHRLQVHMASGWELTSVIMKRNQDLFAALSKPTPKPQPRSNWLGVDVNSPRIAVSIISQSGRVLKQSYYGKDISIRQFTFEKRRALLQQHRDTLTSSKAGQKLKRLSRKQRNYVRTRTWQITNSIVELAKNFNASIAIEKLKGLRKRGTEWSHKSRRKVNRIPYGFLGYTLKHVAEREVVPMQEIDPRYTSQICPCCGYTAKANWKGYAYFKCMECGYEANRDRVASLNIALRAARTGIPDTCNVGLARIPEGSASVSRRVWQGEGFQTTASKNPELQAMNFSHR
jgi:IS605 OrfB family transposase